MTALTELLAKVEAGKVGSGLNTASVFGDTQSAMDAVDAYDGSLDAARELHEAVLPGWDWHVTNAGASVMLGVIDGFDSDNATNPARAWLIAILRALVAKEGET